MAKARNLDRGVTRVKGIRVSEELWDAVRLKAEALGSTRSDEIRRLLVDYASKPVRGRYEPPRDLRAMESM
jgi:hypothetical protein